MIKAVNHAIIVIKRTDHVTAQFILVAVLYVVMLSSGNLSGHDCTSLCIAVVLY